MSFELCEPGQWKTSGGLPEGFISLQKSGSLTVRTDSLALAGIKADDAKCAVMCCSQTNRIAIRGCRDDDAGKAFALRSPTKKKGVKIEHLRILNINVPLRRLGIKPEAYAGRYEVHHKDGLLLLNMLDLSDKDKKLAKPHADAKAKAAGK